MPTLLENFSAHESLARNMLGEIRAEMERCLGDASAGTSHDVLPAVRLRWLQAMCRLEVAAARGADAGSLVELVRSTQGLGAEFCRRVEALVTRSRRAIESNEALRGP
jgi:hypothetical protein